MATSEESGTDVPSGSNDDVELGDIPQSFEEVQTDIVQRKKKDDSALIYSTIPEVARKRRARKQKEQSNRLSRFELFALFVCIILLIFITFFLILYIGKAYKASIRLFTF